jgi:AcrR family transcriptional regulator
VKHLSPQERRNSILIAARRALASRGFFGTRTRDFAREAGVSCALLFRYFPTLKDIHRAVMEHGLKRFPPPWSKKLCNLRPRAGLRAAAEILVGSIDRDPDLLRLALFGALAGMPDSAFLLWRDLLRAERGVASLIRAWKVKRWVSPDADATGIARLIVSAWMGEAVVRHLFGLRVTARSLNQMVDGVSGLLEANIRAEGRDPSGDQGVRTGTASVARTFPARPRGAAAWDGGSGAAAARRIAKGRQASVPLEIGHRAERRVGTTSNVRSIASP